MDGDESRRGILSFRAGDTKAALKCFVEACRREPDNHVHHMNCCAALVKLGRNDKALIAAARCLELKPACVKALFRGGKALHALELYSGAALALFAGLSFAQTKSGEEHSLLHDCEDYEAESDYEDLLVPPNVAVVKCPEYKLDISSEDSEEKPIDTVEVGAYTFVLSAFVDNCSECDALLCLRVRCIDSGDSLVATRLEVHFEDRSPADFGLPSTRMFVFGGGSAANGVGDPVSLVLVLLRGRERIDEGAATGCALSVTLAVCSASPTASLARLKGYNSKDATGLVGLTSSPNRHVRGRQEINQLLIVLFHCLPARRLTGVEHDGMLPFGAVHGEFERVMSRLRYSSEPVDATRLYDLASKDWDTTSGTAEDFISQLTVYLIQIHFLLVWSLRGKRFSVPDDKIEPEVLPKSVFRIALDRRHCCVEHAFQRRLRFFDELEAESFRSVSIERPGTLLWLDLRTMTPAYACHDDEPMALDWELQLDPLGLQGTHRATSQYILFAVFLRSRINTGFGFHHVAVRDLRGGGFRLFTETGLVFRITVCMLERCWDGEDWMVVEQLAYVQRHTAAVWAISAPPEEDPMARLDTASTAMAELKCAVCGLTEGSLFQCTRCRSVAYCSREHQKAAWPDHKAVCAEAVARAAAGDSGLDGPCPPPWCPLQPPYCEPPPYYDDDSIPSCTNSVGGRLASPELPTVDADDVDDPRDAPRDEDSVIVSAKEFAQLLRMRDECDDEDGGVDEGKYADSQGKDGDGGEGEGSAAEPLPSDPEERRRIVAARVALAKKQREEQEAAEAIETERRARAEAAAAEHRRARAEAEQARKATAEETARRKEEAKQLQEEKARKSEERRKEAEERKQQDAQRKAEQKRRDKERQKEDARKAAEEQRRAAAAEEQRIADERARRETEKEAEKARKEADRVRREELARAREQEEIKKREDERRKREEEKRAKEAEKKKRAEERLREEGERARAAEEAARAADEERRRADVARRKQQAVSSAGPRPAGDDLAAEEERLYQEDAQEKKRVDAEIRKAETLKREQEAAREEKRRKDEERKREMERRAQEKKEAEEARKHEQRRRADERKKVAAERRRDEERAAEENAQVDEALRRSAMEAQVAEARSRAEELAVLAEAQRRLETPQRAPPRPTVRKNQREIILGPRGRAQNREETEARERETERRRPCFHFASHGRCKFGDACPFLHDASTSPSGVCVYFARGICRLGAACKFRHDAPALVGDSAGGAPRDGTSRDDDEHYDVPEQGFFETPEPSEPPEPDAKVLASDPGDYVPDVPRAAPAPVSSGGGARAPYQPVMAVPPVLGMRMPPPGLAMPPVGAPYPMPNMLWPPGASPLPPRPAPVPPLEYLDPLTRQVMEDPVFTVDGHTFERASIAAWFQKGNRTSPVTQQPLDQTTLIPNHALRNTIQRWREML